MAKEMDPENPKPAQEHRAPSTSVMQDAATLATMPMMTSQTSMDTDKKPRSGVQIHEPPVTETRGYQVIKVEEKHGKLHQAIPVMPLPLAVLCCLFNIVLPGFGTFISSFSVFCCGSTRIAKPCHAFGLNIASALLQMVTFLVIVGWIWSIQWGMTMVQMSFSSSKTSKYGETTPYYVRRQSSMDYEKQVSRQSH